MDPHSEDNLVCRECGHTWHRECVLKTKSCPNCRSTSGYVKPRSYDRLIHIISEKKIRCNYCNLLIKSKTNPQTHLSKCKKYELHVLRRTAQARKVLCKSMEQNIPQDPIELNPLSNLKTTFTTDVVDLRSQPRHIAMTLEIEQTMPQNHFELILRPESTNPFPLNLSLLISDSLSTVAQFICIPDADTQLKFPIVVAQGSAFRLWLTAL